MTPTTLAGASTTSQDNKVIALVSAAHFISHYYILILPPLFLEVRADFNVSYVELGLALTVFNFISGAMQTPAGMLIDRVSARAMLVGGLALGAGALVLAGLSNQFWLFTATFALLGLANTVYHPANYALLSHRVSLGRMSQAYSVHTFAGMLGSALAPASLLFLAASFGWRGAFLAAAVPGFAVAALLLVAGGALARIDPPTDRARAAEAPGVAPDLAALPRASTDVSSRGWRLLVVPAILINFVFFVLLSLAGAGVQYYSLVAIEAMGGPPPRVTNLALSVYLGMSALGVLIGGYAASRTRHHDGIAVAGLALSSVAVLALALFDLNAPALLVLMTIAGLFQGIIMPSRDMLVRAITPAGSFGTVFGFVTTGFNVAGMVAPLVFGWMMDQGYPRAVFVVSAIAGFACIPAVLMSAARRPS